MIRKTISTGVLPVAMLSLSFLLLAQRPAYATDGYFQTGYGEKTVAMGGASDGVVTGAMGGANNPASIAFAGESFAIGANYFVPHRSASRRLNAFGLNGSSTSNNDNFLIPQIGYSNPIGRRLALGITIYGNGGLNTDYPTGQIPSRNCGYPPGTPSANLLCGIGHLGVNLAQLIIAPTIAYKVTPDFALAVSPQLVYQTFSAEGIQPFERYSENPGAVTDHGGDNAFGIGVKLGAFWRITPKLSAGATYAPQADMETFTKYAGLFAGAGAFSLPANYSVGLGYQLSPRLLIAANYQRILYADVPSIGNQSNNQAPLGAANGPGFGWRNINVYKIGGAYRINDLITLRAGYNHAENPVTARNVTFNILAPGVIRSQASFGLTYHITPTTSVTASYLHAFNNQVQGPTSPLLPGGGTDRISLEENAIGIGVDIRM